MLVQTTPRNQLILLRQALSMLPRPITLWEHVVHYVTVRDIMNEIDAWTRLSNINIAVVGFVKGGEFKPE